MKKLCIGLTCFCVISLAGCEAINSSINAVNETLSSMNNSSGNASGGNTNHSVTVPDSVKQATVSAFTTAPNNQIQNLVNDAKPTIIEMVSKAACGTDNSVMGRYTDPDSYTSMYVDPMIGMRYHKTGCLNPIRIQGWEKASANALRFSVVYMSPQSEETTRRSYTAVKQPDGTWLFQW